MNEKEKKCLEILAVLVITIIIACSSPLNPWISNSMTAVQSEIFSIAHSVREGYLAYVETDGHYGPVLYEFYGLGYLPTETHVVHFVMELIIVFVAVLFLYKTAKLYTSKIFALIATAIITIFGWGALTTAGAEELMFVILSLSAYHIARQLTSGFLSHHTYLLAIDMGLVFFLQPGYVFAWVIVIVFFAVYFRVKRLEGKEYRAFYWSTLEGIVTVVIPMGIYLWYFKNAGAFWQQVIVYNMNNLGSLGAGLGIVCGSLWLICLCILVVVMIIKGLKGENIVDLCCWLGITVVYFVVIALQGDNLDSFLELSKVLYIVPLASLGSILDKPLGLKKD